MGSFENAWVLVQTKAAVVIQKYARGFIVRKKYKKEVEQIKEAG